MKLVLGADLHGHLPRVPPCDVLVLAGDLLPEIDQERFIDGSFRRWLNNIPARHVVATWGNHDDKPFDQRLSRRRDFNDLRWRLLVDRDIIIDGIKFHGTPWCLPIGRWAWQAPEYVLEKIYDMIPTDTQVLISHTPPFGICDKTDPDFTRRKPNENAGSRALSMRMTKLDNLELLVCGHIHEARGQSGIVVNASSLTRSYLLRSDPWIIKEL